MTRGIKVEVGDGWSAIVLNMIVVGSRYPEHWKFRFHRAWRELRSYADPRDDGQ